MIFSNSQVVVPFFVRATRYCSCFMVNYTDSRRFSVPPGAPIAENQSKKKSYACNTGTWTQSASIFFRWISLIPLTGIITVRPLFSGHPPLSGHFSKVPIYLSVNCSCIWHLYQRPPLLSDRGHLFAVRIVGAIIPSKGAQHFPLIFLEAIEVSAALILSCMGFKSRANANGVTGSLAIVFAWLLIQYGDGNCKNYYCAGWRTKSQRLYLISVTDWNITVRALNLVHWINFY